MEIWGHRLAIMLDLRGHHQSDTKWKPTVGCTKLLLGLVLPADQRGILICSQPYEPSSGKQARPVAGGGGLHRILDEKSRTHDGQAQ